MTKPTPTPQGQHTPTPLRVKAPTPSTRPAYEIVDANSNYVASIEIRAKNSANEIAAFIVRAVNSHEELLAIANTRRIELIGAISNTHIRLKKQILEERLEVVEQAIARASGESR